METIENSPVPQPTQPIQPVPAEPKKKSNLPVIVILLIAILLVGVGGVYAGMQISKKQTPVVLPTAPPQEIRPTTIPASPDSSQGGPTSISDETSNWKTYTNTKYGFEFKYPQEWKINRGPGGESDEMLSKSNEVSFFQGNSGFVLQIDEFEGKCLTLKDCISKISLINSNYKDSTKEAKTFLNYPAEAITYNRIDTQLNQGNIELFSFTNDKFYHFHFYDINNDFEKTKIIFDQILSTFKFTE